MKEGENHPRLLRKNTDISKEEQIIKVSQNTAKKRGHIERFNERHCRKHHSNAQMLLDLCGLLLLESFESPCFPMAYALTSFALILV